MDGQHPSVHNLMGPGGFINHQMTLYGSGFRCMHLGMLGMWDLASVGDSLTIDR